MLALVNKQQLRAAPCAGTRSCVPLRPHAARSRSRTLVVKAVLDIQGEAAWEQEVLKSDTPVLVDVWAPWCGPCKLVAPLMDWAEKEYAGRLKVVKVNHTPNPELVAKYKVYGLPAFMVFVDGQLVAGSHHEGAISKAALASYIDRHVPAVVSA